VSALTSRVLAVLAIAAGAAVLFAPGPPAVAAGLLLGFVLPGMALLDVLFRRRTVSRVERCVLTPALSMGVLIVAGLGIHAAGLRIDRLAWAVTTVGVTLAALAAARLPGRRAPIRGPEGDQPRPVAGTTVRLPPPGPAEANTAVIAPAADEQPAEQRSRRGPLVRQVLLLVLVAAVLGGASWLSFHTSRTSHDAVVTALSATPPGPVDAAGQRSVRVTASGLLAGDGPYTVRVTGTAGTATVERTVAVTGDGTWSEALSLPGAQRMTVNLYRSGDTTAYRTLLISAVE